MTQTLTQSVQVQVTPGGALRGTCRVPGDKSISHRALILGALAEGASAVRSLLDAGDTRATRRVMQALGVPISVGAEGTLIIQGRGLGGLEPPAAPLDCGHAGTAIRLLAGALAGQRFASVLDGSAQLRRRPMRRVVDPLRQMGAQIADTDGHAPLHITGSPLHGIAYRMPVASAQVKSALLLAGLRASGPTAVIEPGPARDHTERILRAMGADVETADGCCVTLVPPQRLRPLDLRAAQAPQLSVWQTADLQGDDLLSLEVSVDGGLSWLPIDIQPGWKGAWMQRTVDLTGFRGTVIGLRFVLTSGPSNQGNANRPSTLAIDELGVQEVIAPTAMPLPTTAPTTIPTTAPALVPEVVAPDPATPTPEPPLPPTDMPAQEPTLAPTEAPAQEPAPTEQVTEGGAQ